MVAARPDESVNVVDELLQFGNRVGAAKPL
jgi:hypothetical protein